MKCEKIKELRVMFLFPGALIAESENKKIEKRKMPIIPKNCFAYFFYDYDYVIVDGVKYDGKISNQTGNYFPDGVVYTTADLKRKFPQEKTLISNCENNGDVMVQTRLGNWQIFDNKKDKIINFKVQF